VFRPLQEGPGLSKVFVPCLQLDQVLRIGSHGLETKGDHKKVAISEAMGRDPARGRWHCSA
jgi:hypothetical protein